MRTNKQRRNEEVCAKREKKERKRKGKGRLMRTEKENERGKEA